MCGVACKVQQTSAQVGNLLFQVGIVLIVDQSQSGGMIARRADNIELMYIQSDVWIHAAQDSCGQCGMGGTQRKIDVCVIILTWTTSPSIGHFCAGFLGAQTIGKLGVAILDLFDKATEGCDLLVSVCESVCNDGASSRCMCPCDVIMLGDEDAGRNGAYHLCANDDGHAVGVVMVQGFVVEWFEGA